MWFSLQPASLLLLQDAPLVFSKEVLVAVSASRLFEVLADPTLMPQWFWAARQARWVSADRCAVDAVREVRLRAGSLREHFIEWQPAKRMAFYVAHSSVPLFRQMVEDYQLEELGPQACRLSWRVGCVPLPWTRPVQRLGNPLLERICAPALEGLVRYASGSSLV